MPTITLATPEEWKIVIAKYCTCKSKDMFPEKHRDKCGYRKWYKREA